MIRLNPDIFLQPISKIGVTRVTGVTPASIQAISVTPEKNEGVTREPASIQAISVTPEKNEGVTREPASIKGVTPVTHVTPKNEYTCNANDKNPDGKAAEVSIVTAVLCGTDATDIFEAFNGEELKVMALQIGTTWRPGNPFFLRSYIPNASMDETYLAYWTAVRHFGMHPGATPEAAERYAASDCRRRRAEKGR